jgi:hypothetical protein
MKLSLICVAATVAIAVAQDQTAASAPKQEKVAVSQQRGDSELGLFGGAVIPPGGGGKFGGGANFAYALSTYIYPYVEFSVLPGALNDSVSAGSSTFRTTGDAIDFHGGLHIRLPFFGPQFVPYGVIAVGGFKPYSVNLQELSGGTVINTSSVSQGTNFAVNYGGGIRYYITNRVGVRLEVKAYGPTSHFGGTPVRVMGGIFFQFKGKNH